MMSDEMMSDVSCTAKKTEVFKNFGFLFPGKAGYKLLISGFLDFVIWADWKITISHNHKIGNY